jgi:organic radical activating enzyme
MLEKYAVEDFPKYLHQYLNQDGINFDGYILTGGEPLHNLSMTEFLINTLVERYGDDVPIFIETNGSLLNEELVSEFNVFENINFILSINSVYTKTNEKSVENIIDKSKDGYSVVKAVQKLKRKSINMVVDNFRNDLELEILALHNMFDCNIDLSLNELKLDELVVDDAFYLQKTLARLESLDLKDVVNFDNILNMKESKKTTILPTGDVIENEVIGVEILDLIIKILDNYFDV